MKTNQPSKTAHKWQDTYIYIDASNIRSCCLKTSDFLIDFVKLLTYFQQRYPNLKEVRYYEGIANDDAKKRTMFNFLQKKGYTICSLERKSYTFTEIKAITVKCPKCKNQWTKKITEDHLSMKSNVDVYLASDIMARASIANRPTRIILVSCDCDYAEMIKNALNLNPNISIAILATPTAKDFRKNTLSIRLKQLLIELPRERFRIHYIHMIRNKIESTKPLTKPTKKGMGRC